MNQLSRKEKEYLARREYILDAAREIFSQRGFAEATIEEIAEKAEFGKGTIYNYFPSKQELFITLIEEGIAGLIQIAHEVVAADIDPVEKVSLLLRRQIQHFQENAGLFRIVHIEQRCTELPRIHEKIEIIRQIILDIFAAGVKQKVFKQYEPQKLRIMYSGFVHACVFLYWSGVKQFEPLTEAEINEMLDCFLSGIVRQG